MKSKFDAAFEKILVEDIEKTLCLSFGILSESHLVMQKPDLLFKEVKNALEELYEKKDFNTEIKINIFKALEDSACSDFKDDDLHQVLVDLFQEKKDSYFLVKLGSNTDFYEQDNFGTFTPPEKFTSFMFNDISRYSLPKIQPIKGIDNALVEGFCKEFNKTVDKKQQFYNLKKKAIEAFRKTILEDSDKCFGKIVVNIDKCIEEDEVIDDVICHECQHLCIFLLSLAKSCVWFGLHFSNNIQTMSYNLKESEFLTLASSYIKTLKRLYISQNEASNMPKTEFVHRFLDFALNGSDDSLFSGYKMSVIAKFFKALNEDENYKKSIATPSKLGKFTKAQATKKMKSEKFTKLMKWLLKAFDSLS